MIDDDVDPAVLLPLLLGLSRSSGCSSSSIAGNRRGEEQPRIGDGGRTTELEGKKGMINTGREQGGGEESDSEHNHRDEKDAEDEEEVLEQITNFMAVTGSDSANVARQYLEMSGNHLETAISLFLDHGGVVGTGARGEDAAGRSGGGEDLKEGEKGEEPNNFDALPPMPPLSSSLNQVPINMERMLPAERIVESALREYCAFRTIRRALLTHWIQRRHHLPRDGSEGVQPQPPRGNESSKQLVGIVPTGLPQDVLAAPKKKPNTLARGPVSHFLFQSLLHSSLPVRRAAARMILHNFHQVLQRDQISAKKTNAPSINCGDLQQVLIILLHGLMFGEAPTSQHQRTVLEVVAQTHHEQQQQPRWSSSSHHPMIPCYKNQSDGGDPALQIMGLLVSLVCDGGFSNILVCKVVMDLFQQQQQQQGVPLSWAGAHGSQVRGGDSSRYFDTGYRFTEEDILASSLLRELSSDSIESFVASGGLRWACGSILRLVHMLVHGSTRPIIAGGGTRHSHVGTNTSGGDYSHVNHCDSRSRSHVVDPMDDITSCTIQSRLLLLIDLVYRLVLFGSVPAAVDRHTLSLRVGNDSKVADERVCSSKGCAQDNNSNRNESIPRASTDNQVPRTRAQYDLIPRSDGSGSVVQGVATGKIGSMAATDRTARTSYLQRLASRSSVPPIMAGTSRSRGIGTKRSFARSSDNSVNGGDPSTGAGAGSKGEIDENFRRKECRRSTLERVHKAFWSSDLPAAMCATPDRTLSIVAPDYGVKSDGSASAVLAEAAAVESSLAGFVHLSPLACLVAAHEILRSRPISHAALSINQRLRALEKGIAILGRIVDPIASTALVVVDNELPWELAEKLLGSDYGKKSMADVTGGGVKNGCTARRYGAITHPRSSRKLNRSSSHDGRCLRSSCAPTELLDSTTMRSSPFRFFSGGIGDEIHGVRGTDSSPSIIGHRTKRARLASSNVTSILETLPRVGGTTSGGVSEVGGAGVAASSNSNTARSGTRLAAARVETMFERASLPLGGVGSGGQPSSNSAARHRSATESMRRLSPSGTGNSASVASAATASRDGTLSRLLALGGGYARSSNIRTGSSNSVSTTASPAISTASRSLMRERAMAAAEVEEWRVLHDLPEGGDLMDIDDDDVAYLSDADDDGNDDCGNIDDEEDANEEGNDNSIVDEDEDEDSDAESLFEVDYPDHSNKIDEDEGNVIDEGEDDSEGEDEDAVARSKIYDEETDDDTSQFDDAVINLEDINLTTSSGITRYEYSHQGHHPVRNPHRQSFSRIPASSHHGSGSSLSHDIKGNSGSSMFDSPMSAALMKRDREQAYVRAAMSILSAQYPGLLANSTVEYDAGLSETSLRAKPCTTIDLPLLTSDSEQSLLKSLCNIVKPPRKPLNLKIFLRRAPTQEEYFRGSLSRNPIGLSSLRVACAATGTSGGSGGVNPDDRRISSGGVGTSGSNDEPLVSDLRMHIAKDLQMEDSSELLELLVANRILDMNLKLRVVQQVLWRRFVEENATSASSSGVAGAGPSHQMISTGNGLSMIFSSSGLVAARNSVVAGGRGSVVGSDESAILLESFPPMVVTYRLAGVDGEATEDKVEFDDLDDPEALSTANLSPSEAEQRMEKEFGITRLILSQRNGIALLLENIESTISDCLRRMRRDEVARRRLLRRGFGIEGEAVQSNEYGNGAREHFAKAPACPALVLLRLSANISDNRKLMLANRAPTLLLRILLDILNDMNKSLERLGSKKGERARSSTFDSSAYSMEVETTATALGVNATKVFHHVDGNPTTDALQEIIEMLASDISSEISDGSKSVTSNAKNSSSSSFVSLIQAENNRQKAEGVGENQDEDRTLPLVLRSLHSMELSPPLRKVIAKLLPFLTYGEVSQSKELASYFSKYINVTRLGMVDGPLSSEEQERHQRGNDLFTTFVEAAINLPPVPVCNNLRKELLSNGFVDSVQTFLIEGAPTQPPPWSPALYSVSSEKLNKLESSDLMEKWRNYLNRPGLSQAFKILTGLCSRHVATQLYLSGVSSSGDAEEARPSKDFNFLPLCHWIESTSDNSASNILNSCGILAETLLDALKEDNETSSAKIDALRKNTRESKRKLAEERRSKALGGIHAFGAYAEQRTLPAARGNSSSVEEVSVDNRSMLAAMFSSILAPTLSSTLPCTRASVTKEATVTTQASQQHKVLPSWVAEMEALADEAGVTCAVCQEGHSLQPSELLGLYAYMKKVTIPSSQGGGKGDIDGTGMLLSLPASFPRSLGNVSDMESLFTRSRQAANALEGSSHALSAMASSTSFSTGSGSSRTSCYVTTVSAGNAIHCSCHKNAKAADRNHPKAPKSKFAFHT